MVGGALGGSVEEAGVGLSARDLVLGMPPVVAVNGAVWVETESTLDCLPRGEWQVVMATLDEPMPPGTELEVELFSPAAEVTLGRQRLSERSAMLAFRLPAKAGIPLRLRYRFRHDLLAATGSFSRSVLFTLIDP